MNRSSDVFIYIYNVNNSLKNIFAEFSTFTEICDCNSGR